MDSEPKLPPATGRVDQPHPVSSYRQPPLTKQTPPSANADSTSDAGSSPVDDRIRSHAVIHGPHPAGHGRPPHDLGRHAASQPKPIPTVPNDPPDRQEWLQLHAEELITKLQTWAGELREREANLQVLFARQESRERKFRMQAQAWEAEMIDRQRSIDALRNRMQEQARRLAFEDA
ncbi:MAG: hypothetical protein AAGA03_01825 [Planctomycetota bacterium]